MLLIIEKMFNDFQEKTSMDIKWIFLGSNEPNTIIICVDVSAESCS